MKVPEPKQLASGTWYIQLRLGGKSHFISADTYAECKAQAELVKAQHRAAAAKIKKEPAHRRKRSEITVSKAIGRPMKLLYGASL